MMNIENKLKKFLFPISERNVFVDNLNRGELKKSSDHKAIYRTDKNRLIAIQKNSYKVVQNADILLPLLEEINKLNTKYIIDDSHSYVTDNRMRLQLTFPTLKFWDGESDIALSLYVHNSYDSSEGVRILFGAIRGICTNGMIFGEVFSRIYKRHTQGIDLKNIGQQIRESYDMIPAVKEKIETLKRLKVSDSVIDVIEDELGKTIYNYVKINMPIINHWQLYNVLSYYISHFVKMHMRAHYQIQVSKLFNL